MASDSFSSADLELLNSIGKEHSLVRRALLLFLLITGFIALPLLFFLEKDYLTFISEVKGNDQHQLETMSIQTSSDLKVLMSDIIRLTDFVESGLSDKQGTEWIAQEFMQLARYRLYYDQLRFIDARGDEQVRIDWEKDHAVLRERSVLQNKAHRYYFSETISLQHGQVYLSEIDFNRENGKIEIPHKMTLRMAAPVIGRDGKPSGIVVINYLPNHLFNVSGISSRLEGRLQIIDSHGNQLINEANIPNWSLRSEELSEKYQSLLDVSDGRTQTIRQGRLMTSMIRVEFSFLNTLFKSTDWFFIRETQLPGRVEVWFSERGDVLLFGSFAGGLLSALIAFLLARNHRDQLRRNTLREITHACVGQSPNAIMIADDQQRIVYVNQSFSELTGYSFDEVRGQTPKFLKSGKTPESTYASLREKLEQDKIWHGEFINRKANNTLFWCKASLCTLYPKDSQSKLYVCIESDITPLKESEKKLRHQATHDPMTGLGNRDFLFSAMAETLPSLAQACCLVVDIDHFKKVNDTYGHHTGDLIIKGVADLMAGHARQTDIAARYGGEEFVLILPGVSESQAMMIAERLRRSVEETVFRRDEAGRSGDLVEIRVTISVGCSLFSHPVNEIDFEQMIHNADLALYDAKHSGRNRVVNYAAGMAMKAERDRIGQDKAEV